MCEQDLPGDEGMYEQCSLTAGCPSRERMNTIQTKKGEVWNDHSQGSLAEKSRGPGQILCFSMEVKEGCLVV